LVIILTLIRGASVARRRRYAVARQLVGYSREIIRFRPAHVD